MSLAGLPLLSAPTRSLPWLSLPGWTNEGVDIPTPDEDYLSAADVLAYWLVSQHIGADPDLDPVQDWAIYVGDEPDGDDIPDNVITIYDTSGIISGRSGTDGLRVDHDGIQVRIRSANKVVGANKARRIKIALDRDATQQVVETPLDFYRIHAVTRTTNVVPLGRESPTSQRSLFTINAIMSYEKLSESPFNPLLEGLWAYYQFNGDLTDSSGNGRDLTPSGPSTFGPGILADALYSGEGDLSDMTGLSPAGPFSLSMWLAGGAFGLAFRDAADGELVGVEADTSTILFVWSNSVLATVTRTGGLDHLVITFDGVNLIVYFNGAVVYSAANPPALGVFNHLQVNSNNTIPQSVVDETAIYSRDLSMDEVLALRNGGVGLDPTQ